LLLSSAHEKKTKKWWQASQLAIICIVPIYKLNQMNFQHT
jgi:hypothetical protein